MLNKLETLTVVRLGLYKVDCFSWVLVYVNLVFCSCDKLKESILIDLFKKYFYNMHFLLVYVNDKKTYVNLNSIQFFHQFTFL